MFGLIEIDISLKLEEYDPVKLLEEVLEIPLKVDIEEGNVFSMEAHKTEYPLYPSCISAWWDEKALGFGEHAEIEIAEKLYRKKKINSVVTCFYDLVGNLDPQDPYWRLVYENGRWYFGDVSIKPPTINKIVELNLTKLLAGEYIYGVNI